MTPQEKALKKARKTYGPSAFTEDTLNYRRIGYRYGHKEIVAIGETWEEAEDTLWKASLELVDKIAGEK